MYTDLFADKDISQCGLVISGEEGITVFTGTCGIISAGTNFNHNEVCLGCTGWRLFRQCRADPEQAAFDVVDSWRGICSQGLCDKLQEEIQEDKNKRLDI